MRRGGGWIALGAILGVGVLIAAGIYIPRKTQTHADPNQSAFPSGGSPGSGQPPQQDTLPTNTAAPHDASTGGTQPNGPANGGIPPSGADTSASGDTSSSSTLGPGAGKGSGKESTNGGGRTARGDNGGNPKPWRGGQGNASGQSGAANAQATPTIPPGPSPEELAKLEDEADKLNVRASTVSQSVETMRKQQMAAGYNLRADIAGSAERMQLYVAKGNAALKAQDTTSARKYFDLADAEISKVEKFLGH